MKNMAMTLLVLMFGGGLLLFGGCRHGHDRGSHLDFAIDYLEEILDLNPGQKTQLDAIRQELLAQSETLRESRKKMHPLFKEQLGSERIDTAAVKEAIGEHRRQLDQMIELAIDRLTEFHATLSPEQRQKLVAKLEKMETWHAGRHQ